MGVALVYSGCCVGKTYRWNWTIRQIGFSNKGLTIYRERVIDPQKSSSFLCPSQLHQRIYKETKPWRLDNIYHIVTKSLWPTLNTFYVFSQPSLTGVQITSPSHAPAMTKYYIRCHICVNNLLSKVHSIPSNPMQQIQLLFKFIKWKKTMNWKTAGADKKIWLNISTIEQKKKKKKKKCGRKVCRLDRFTKRTTKKEVSTRPNDVTPRVNSLI